MDGVSVLVSHAGAGLRVPDSPLSSASLLGGGCRRARGSVTCRRRRAAPRGRGRDVGGGVRLPAAGVAASPSQTPDVGDQRLDRGVGIPERRHLAFTFADDDAQDRVRRRLLPSRISQVARLDHGRLRSVAATRFPVTVGALLPPDRSAEIPRGLFVARDGARGSARVAALRLVRVIGGRPLPQILGFALTSANRCQQASDATPSHDAHHFAAAYHVRRDRPSASRREVTSALARLKTAVRLNSAGAQGNSVPPANGSGLR